MAGRYVAAVVAAAGVLLVAGGVGRWQPRCADTAQAVYAVAQDETTLCMAVAICTDGRWQERVNPASCHRVGP